MEMMKWCIIVGFLENGAAKVAFALFNSPVNFVDLVAFTTYKYFALSVLSLLGTLFTYLPFSGITE